MNDRWMERRRGAAKARGAFGDSGKQRSALRRKRRTGAFTLLELIVVITIIGILGTVVVVKVQGWVWRAKEMKIKNDLKSIVDAAEQYHLVAGTYPGSLEEMKPGAKLPDGSEVPGTIENSKDPWGNEYIFEMGQDGKPQARCLGKDQTEGGEGENRDYQYPDLGGGR